MRDVTDQLTVMKADENGDHYRESKNSKENSNKWFIPFNDISHSHVHSHKRLEDEETKNHTTHDQSEVQSFAQFS